MYYVKGQYYSNFTVKTTFMHESQLTAEDRAILANGGCIEGDDYDTYIDAFKTEDRAKRFLKTISAFDSP
jgi:hypothetical protein